MNPVQQIIRLANDGAGLFVERVDTASYTILIGAPSLGATLGFCSWRRAGATILVTAVVREALRFMSWHFHKQTQLVGGSFIRVDKTANKYAAASVANFVGGCALPSVTPHTMIPDMIGAGAFFIAAYACSRQMGTPGLALSNIRTCYFHPAKGMWDWKSRGSGGGKWQQFLDAAYGLKPNLLGEPVLNPIPIPVHKTEGAALRL